MLSAARCEEIVVNYVAHQLPIVSSRDFLFYSFKRTFAAPNPCAPPGGIANVSPNGVCGAIQQLPSGFTCAPQCDVGYSPSVATLQCSFGTLSPATLTCIPLPCTATPAVVATGGGRPARARRGSWSVTSAARRPCSGRGCAPRRCRPPSPG